MKQKNLIARLALGLTFIFAFMANVFAANYPAKVYILSDEFEWIEPLVSNAERIKSVDAISDGVYEVEISPYNDMYYFSFFTALTDDEKAGVGGAWNSNRVYPVDSKGKITFDGADLQQIGRSGVCTISAALIARADVSASMVVRDACSGKLRLDLNEGKVYFVPENTIFPLFNDKKNPTYETLADYQNTDGQPQYYAEAGKESFYLYDFSKGKRYGGGEISSDPNIDGNAYHEESSTPFSISDWQGGVVKFLSSNRYYTRVKAMEVENSTPTDKDRFYVSLEGYDVVAPIKANERILDIANTRLEYYSAEGAFKGELEIPAGMFSLNIISELGDTEDATKFVCPVDDGVLLDSQPVVNCDMRETTREKATRWTCPGWTGGKVTITVFQDGTVRFELPDIFPDRVAISSLYLVGSPQGWNIDNNSMPLQYTDAGTYYGEFDVEPGNIIFRFYTRLGNWEDGSIGSQREDAPVDFSNNMLGQKLDLFGGKGSFEFPDWTGTKLYVEVSINEHWVIVSDKPFEHGVVGTPKYRDVYTYDGEVYDMQSSVPDSDEVSFNIYSDTLTLFEQMPEYPAGDNRWKQSAMKFSLTAEYSNARIRKYVSNPQGECEFSVNPGDRVVLVGDELYIGPFNASYLLVDKEAGPTLQTLGNFEDKAMLDPFNTLNPLQLSAGDHVLKVYRVFDGADDYVNQDYSEPAVVRMDGKPSASPELFSNHTHYEIKGWEGGGLMLSQDAVVVNMNKVDKLQYTLYSGNEAGSEVKTEKVIVSESQKGMGLFDFTIPAYPEMYTAGNLLVLVEIPDAHVYLSPVYSQSDPRSELEKEMNVYLEDGAAERRFVLGGNPFLLPEIKKGSVDVKVNLNTLDMTMAAASENIVKSAEVLLGGSDKSVTSIMADATNANTSVKTSSIESLAAQDYTLTVGIDKARGMRAPALFGSASAAALNFNKFGVATAAYDPNVLNQWSFTVEKESPAVLTLDEGKKRMTLFVQDKSDAYFFQYFDGAKQAYAPALEDFDYNHPNALLPQEDGTYRGIVNVPKGEYGFMLSPCISASASAMNVKFGIVPLDETTVDFAQISKEAPVEYEASNAMAYSYNTWRLKNDRDGISAEITYDPKLASLGVRVYDDTAVDAVEADGASVSGVNGGLIARCAAPMTLVVYNLQGGIVKVCELGEGETFIAVPAGIYVTAYGKHLVR